MNMKKIFYIFFFYLTDYLPLFSNIFIFGEETKEQEYLPFLYKVLTIDSLFVIVIKECKNGNEDNLFKKINEIFVNNKTNYFLVLLYSKQNINKIEKFIKEYKPLEYENKIDCKEKIKNILKGYVSLVYSDISGAGKTTYINSSVKNNYNMNYIYFPIKANYTKKELIHQLKDVIKINENVINVIHLDLYDSISENIIKEFLFDFIFFKFYGEDNDIFNYGYYEDYKIKIIIELPNTYKNYFDKYKILNYIHIEKQINILAKNNIINLKENSNKTKIGESRIQIVANTINLFNNSKIMTQNLNLYNKELLSQEKCNEIINKTLFDYLGESSNDFNFYQKKNFIKLLSSEFINFSKCANLSSSKDEMKNIREYIIKSIITNAKNIIELNNLEKKLFEVNINIKKESEREINFQRIKSEFEKEKKMINYDTLNPCLIGLHSDGNFLSVISSNNDNELIKAINNHIKLINIQFKLNWEYIKNPNELKSEEYRRELLKIIVDENMLDNGQSKYENIEAILDHKFKDYVFTMDNYLKMVLLFLRLRAGIPTIIIGETGSGKTYLIKMLSLIYGQNENLYVLKFHTGITDDMIINFIINTIERVKRDEDEIIKKIYDYISDNKYIDNYKQNEDKYLEKLWFFQKWFFNSNYNEKYKQYKEKISDKIKKRKIIIFFDEINTTNSLGTIKRIMCDRNFRKKYKIPNRFIIICACNPYRILSEENQNLQFGLTMRYQKKRRLVYTVNPLPYSLLNFTLYFNDISEGTAKSYIEKMNEKIEKIKNIKNLNLINKIVVDSHFFITKKGDISSVSLREINRFPKIFNFFYKEYFNIFRKQKLEEEELEIKSIVFGLYFCYYLRLPTSKMRNEYINEIIIKHIPNFLEICKKESIFITEKVLEGKIGYAKNKGLCENILSEFISILLKEPLIICGKPGSSKSLSVRMLLNAMKGEKSPNDFFKQFPEIIPSFYQCSLTSTSENLLKVFKSAKNKLEKRKYKIISLIFIDEMGIAEENKNNPLKVLHSELDENNEIIENDKKLSFIGISNWTLDASKMNRAINIVVEEPDLNYLLTTAKEIVKSIDNKLEIIFDKILKSICEAYLDYLKIQRQQIKEDFHGFRDFYYVIKYIFNNISKKYKKEANIDNYLIYIFQGIYRNFGGFKDSLGQNSENIFKNIFLEKYNNEKVDFEYNILDRIKDNLESCIDCRYLLLINNDGKINEIFLDYILKDKEYVIISDEDISRYDNKSNEILNILLKKEILMKKDTILILKNLEILYPSLYELFNKNFSEYGSENKFVKISYEENQSLVQVNEKFRIIILVNEENINYEEKPFLNRFEKQIFSINNILKKEELNLIDHCYSFIEKFKTIYGFHNLDYINKDLLYLFFIPKSNEKEINRENEFWKKLISLFSQEMIFYLNNYIEKEIPLDKKIINISFKSYYREIYNFKSFLVNTTEHLNVIYTYSENNLPVIKRSFYNKYLKIEFSSGKTKTILAEEINEKTIKDLLDDDNINLYIIKIIENRIINEDIDKLKYIKNFIFDAKKLINNKKIIVYIYYKKRNYNKEEIELIKQKRNVINKIYELLLFYNQLFIDNLNNKYIKDDKLDILINNLFGKREEIINDDNLMENEILNDTFKLIKLKIKNEEGYNFENVNKIQKELKNNKKIFELIKNKLRAKIRNKRVEVNKILQNIKIDFIDSLYNYNKNEICILLKNIMNYLEDELILSTILFSHIPIDENTKNEKYNKFNDLLDKFDDNQNYNGIKFIFFGFNLIGLFKEYKELSMLISNKNNANINIKEDIILNDNYQFKQKLEGSNEEKKFLFNDYILYFISLIIEVEASKEKRDKIICFLNIILKIYFLNYNENEYLNKEDFINIIINKNEEIIDLFETMCLFLEDNKKYLSKLLNMLNEFLYIIPNFNDIFLSLCKNNIKYNDSDKLYRIFKNFLNVIIDESKFSFYFSNDTKEEYLKLLEKNKNKFEKILILLRKKYCQSLLNIYIFLYLVKKDDSNFLKITLNYLNNNIESGDDFLKHKNKIIDNDKVLLNILTRQYRINNNINIFNIFISNEKFIKYSLFFFGNILNEFIDKNASKTNYQNKNLNIPHELEQQLDDVLLNNKNNIVENLLFYFELFYENFYFSIIEDKQKDKGLKYKEILEKDTLTLIMEYIKYYENNQNNINFQLIYRIAFIKIYFRYFANILYDCKSGNEYINLDDLVNNKFYLSAEDLSPVKKNINIYILNILNIKCKKDDFDLKTFIYKYNITYLENYINEIDKNDSLISYNETIIPNKNILKDQFNSDKNNKLKYPLLDYCLNKEDQINYLKKLPIINYICNIMINIYSYKKTIKEIETIKLIDEINNIKGISSDLNFNIENKLINYIKSYNELLININYKSDLIPENKYKNLSIKYYLVNGNDKNNKLNYILNKFIEYQNDFINNISHKYFPNKNFYELEGIYVQTATEENIPKLIASDDEFLDILITNIIISGKTKWEFDLEEIENEIAERIIPGLKRFIKGKIRIMKYAGEEYNEIDEQIIDDFIQRFKYQDLNQKQNDYIKEFILKNKDKKDLLLISFQYLIIFILSHSEYEGETSIRQVIEDMIKNNSRIN